jgi:hypothetical protein
MAALRFLQVVLLLFGLGYVIDATKLSRTGY